MNIALGDSGLLLGLLGALAGAVTLALGTARRRPSLARAGNSYVWLVLAGAVVATLAMERALVTHDFTLRYVDNNDSTFTPLLYRVTAMWSDLAGSVLLWALVLAGYLVAMHLRYRRRGEDQVVAWAKVAGYGVAAFFFGLVLTVSNPFARVSGAVPTQGPGPNPLLQDRALVAFHPPLLYLGLVGFTVPFCLAVATLATGQLGDAWLAEARRWALVAWGFLTAGLVLGMWWSYQVLGWGGYWSWDPVENSALLPWLTSSAFLHSAMVQQRRGMLRVWASSLLLATFSLTILGTFFTRSGVLVSVHSFTVGGGVGPALLGFFALAVAASIGLLAWRGDQLHVPGSIRSAVSREGALLANNLLFAAFAVVVLLGTVFPLVVQAVNGSSVTVGGPFFDTMTMPIVVCLLFLMAVGPQLPWQGAAGDLVRRRLWWPTAVAAAVLVACAAAGLRGPWPLVVFGLGAFAGASALRQLALRLRRSGWRGLTGRGGGGMVAHLGLVVVAVAFAASHAYEHQGQLTLVAGKPASFEGHSLVLRGVQEVVTPGRTALVATIDVDGRPYHPAVQQFALSNQAVGSPAVRSTPAQDVYLALASVPGPGRGPVTVGVVVEPLVMWLWVGGLVLVLGAGLALWPRRPAKVPGGARAEPGTGREGAEDGGPRTAVAASSLPVSVATGAGPGA